MIFKILFLFVGILYLYCILKEDKKKKYRNLMKSILQGEQDIKNKNVKTQNKTFKNIEEKFLLSICCNAPVKVKGNVTMYYVCTKCNKACDIY